MNGKRWQRTRESALSQFGVTLRESSFEVKIKEMFSLEEFRASARV